MDASKSINLKTILELAGRFATAGAAAESLVSAYRSQRTTGTLATSQQGGLTGGNQSAGGGGHTMEGKSNLWARWVLTEANPCC